MTFLFLLLQQTSFKKPYMEHEIKEENSSHINDQSICMRENQSGIQRGMNKAVILEVLQSKPGAFLQGWFIIPAKRICM